jgi:hypothetical protein
VFSAFLLFKHLINLSYKLISIFGSAVTLIDADKVFLFLLLSKLIPTFDLNVRLPAGLKLLREKAPLGKDFCSRLLLGKEKSNAANRCHSEAKYYVDNNEHPFDEFTLLN